MSPWFKLPPKSVESHVYHVRKLVAEQRDPVQVGQALTYLGGSRGRQRKYCMYNLKDWTSLHVPELLMMASHRKDWNRISAESSLIPNPSLTPTPRPFSQGTDLNWTMVKESKALNHNSCYKAIIATKKMALLTNPNIVFKPIGVFPDIAGRDNFLILTSMLLLWITWFNFLHETGFCF